MRRPAEPELERRRRQLEVIEKKAERARTRKDEEGFRAAMLAHESTQTRITELEASESHLPARRRREQE